MIGRSNQYLPIAVDIGTAAVKLIQLRSCGDRLEVHAAGRFEIPPAARRADNRREVIITALRDLLRRHPFKGRRVITMVPNHAIHFKSFRIPQIPAEELEQAVMFEAEERFGFESGEAEYRYLDAGEVRQGQETRTEIIAMACAGEVLRDHIEMFQQLGLVCEIIDAAPCAVVRCYEQPQASGDEDHARIYADVGHQATRVMITYAGRVRFIKSVAVGGEKLAESTAMKLNLSMEEALQLRREIVRYYATAEQSAAIQPEILESAFEASRSSIEQLAKEIGLCLRYYAVTFRGIRPEELICVGGESYHPQLREVISEITGVRATAGNPFKHVDCRSAFPAALRAGGLLDWATAVGLALRGTTDSAQRRAAS